MGKSKDKIGQVKSIFKSVFFEDLEEIDGYLYCFFCYMFIDEESGFLYISVNINYNYSVNFSIFINELHKQGFSDVLIAEPYYVEDEKIKHVTNEDSMAYHENLKIDALMSLVPKSKRVIFWDNGTLTVGDKNIKR